MEQTAEIIRVLLNTPAKSGLFDYTVPPELAGQVRPGQMAVVPFNRSVHQAVVWAVGVIPEVEKLLPVQEIADPVPVMTEAQLHTILIGETQKKRAIFSCGKNHQKISPA